MKFYIRTQVLGPALGDVLHAGRTEKHWKPTVAKNMKYDGNGKATFELPVRNPVMHEGSIIICSEEFLEVLEEQGFNGESAEVEAVKAMRSEAVTNAAKGNFWPTANMKDGIK